MIPSTIFQGSATEKYFQKVQPTFKTGIIIPDYILSISDNS